MEKTGREQETAAKKINELEKKYNEIVNNQSVGSQKRIIEL